MQYSVPSTSTVTDRFGHQVNFIGDTVIEMYSYTQPGQVVGKELQVARQPSSGPALTASLNATWNYTTYNEGHLMGVTYPGDPNGIPVAPSYTYTYDGMGRLNTMTDGTGATIVNGATYNAAGQMLSGVDTRTYNSMGQLTSVTSSTSLNITYTYPNAGQNNGKIASQHDNISGETVSYLYDTLNRLTSATGSGWNQGFVYDPFGNLTDKNGSNSWHGVPDALTNHLGSVDANGNALSSTSATGLGYDAENRLISANYSYQQYAYDAQNKRIWAVAWDNTHSFYTSETYYFYSPQGKVMAQFTPAYQQQNGTLAFMNGAARGYFGGRLLGTEDRLGSRGTYFPYGEDRGSQNPANDNVKFATYTRDSATVLDYADQRFYAATYGRFLTPDPYKASGGSADPQSWNQYAYVGNDPINFADISGLERCDPNEGCFSVTATASGSLGLTGNPEFDASNGFGVWVIGSTNNQAGANEGPGTAALNLIARRLTNSITNALLALNNPDCLQAIFPNATINPGYLLVALERGTSGYGYFELDDIPSAVPNLVISATTTAFYGAVDIGNNATQQVPTGAIIALNVTAGSFVNGTNQDRAITIIHELGHVFNDIPGLGGSTIASDGPSVPNGASISMANSQKIKDNCFK